MQSGALKRERESRRDVKKPISVLALSAVAAALLLSGCGGGASASSEASARSDATGATEVHTPANGEAEESGNAYVSLISSPGLGLILADSEGHALYVSDGDRGATSRCYGACAEAWPPLLTEGPPRPSNGASGAKLGRTDRKGGGVQVTYAGHPLYTFADDKKPGEASGNGVSAFGGRWHALRVGGEEAR